MVFCAVLRLVAAWHGALVPTFIACLASFNASTIAELETEAVRLSVWRVWNTPPVNHLSRHCGNSSGAPGLFPLTLAFDLAFAALTFESGHLAFESADRFLALALADFYTSAFAPTGRLWFSQPRQKLCDLVRVQLLLE